MLKLTMHFEYYPVYPVFFGLFAIVFFIGSVRSCVAHKRIVFLNFFTDKVNDWRFIFLSVIVVLLATLLPVFFLQKNETFNFFVNKQDCECLCEQQFDIIPSTNHPISISSTKQIPNEYFLLLDGVQFFGLSAFFPLEATNVDLDVVSNQYPYLLMDSNFCAYRKFLTINNNSSQKNFKIQNLSDFAEYVEVTYTCNDSSISIPCEFNKTDMNYWFFTTWYLPNTTCPSTWKRDIQGCINLCRGLSIKECFNKVQADGMYTIHAYPIAKIDVDKPMKVIDDYKLLHREKIIKHYLSVASINRATDYISTNCNPIKCDCVDEKYVAHYAEFSTILFILLIELITVLKHARITDHVRGKHGDINIDSDDVNNLLII